MKELLEKIKFNDKGLIPTIIQDEKTREVLTLCYMNQDALLKTLEEGKVYVFRRSKGRLMLKGETSGCVQTVKSLAIDCEGNSILFLVDQERAACHEGYFTCYFRRLKKDGTFEIIGERVFDPKKVYKV
jgi:phosphoribosyl-AMP cyclohydrolase